jgi:hypothetical protein
MFSLGHGAVFGNKLMLNATCACKRQLIGLRQAETGFIFPTCKLVWPGTGCVHHSTKRHEMRDETCLVTMLATLVGCMECVNMTLVIAFGENVLDGRTIQLLASVNKLLAKCFRQCEFTLRSCI